MAKKRCGPHGLAVAPDGKTVYAVNAGSVRPINAVTWKAEPSIRTGSTNGRMVITPDGRMGYVLGFWGRVIPVDLVTNMAQKPIMVGERNSLPSALVMAPDGKTVFVAVSGSRTVVPISTATSTAGKPIRVGQLPDQLAITPDGRTGYVLTYHAVYPISTMSDTAGQPIHLHPPCDRHSAGRQDGVGKWIHWPGDQKAVPGVRAADQHHRQRARQDHQDRQGRYLPGDQAMAIRPGSRPVVL